MPRVRTPRAKATLLGVFLACFFACDARDQDALDARAARALAERDAVALRDAVDAIRDAAEPTPDDQLHAAAWMRRAGRSAEAVWWLQGAVARHPEHVGLRTALAAAALDVGNPALARDTLAALGPAAALPLEALLLDARAELELGRLEPALDLLETAARRDADDPRAVAARVATLLREGQTERADAALRDASDDDLDPATRLALELLAARVLAMRGEDVASLARLEALASRHPGDAAVVGAVIAAHLRAGAFDAARARVDEARGAAPDLPSWSALEAQIAVAAGDLDEAETALREYAEQQGDPSAYLLLASLRRRQDGDAAAAQTLTRGIERNPESALLHFHRLETQIELGDEDEVERALPAFRAMEGTDAYADYLDARRALADGRADEAAAALRDVLPRLDRAYTQYWMGRALEAETDFAGAERRYALALARDPHQVGPAKALLRMAEARGDAAAIASAAGAWASREPASLDAQATWISALVRAGASDVAIRQSDRLALLMPDEVRVAALRVYARRAAGRLDEADALLEAASARFGTHPALNTERALGLAARGRLDAAIATLEETIAAHPGDARRHALLAGLLDRRGDASATERHIARALELDEHDLDPLALRAQIRARAGDDDDALADCERFLAARPRHAGVHTLRAHLLERSGREDEAISGYRRAIEVDPDAVAARNNLALLLADRGALDEARELAQHAYALAGENEPEVVDTLGWIYLRSGHLDRGTALIERAHRAAPERPAPRLHLALAYRDAGRMREARALLDGLPDDPDLDPALRREAHAALASLRD